MDIAKVLANLDVNLILFMLFGVLAIASAVGTVSAKNPVTSAMLLVLHFAMLSCIYFTLNAQFVAALQLLVYAGAIMILVIFVIMLLNLGDEKSFTEKFSFRKLMAILLGVVFVGLISFIYFGKGQLTNVMPQVAFTNGKVEKIGTDLFTKYLVPFEVISLLLLVAVVGAMILAKKKVVHSE